MARLLSQDRGDLLERNSPALLSPLGSSKAAPAGHAAAGHSAAQMVPCSKPYAGVQAQAPARQSSSRGMHRQPQRPHARCASGASTTPPGAAALVLAASGAATANTDGRAAARTVHAWAARMCGPAPGRPSTLPGPRLAASWGAMAWPARMRAYTRAHLQARTCPPWQLGALGCHAHTHTHPRLVRRLTVCALLSAIGILRDPHHRAVRHRRCCKAANPRFRSTPRMRSMAAGLAVCLALLLAAGGADARRQLGEGARGHLRGSHPQLVNVTTPRSRFRKPPASTPTDAPFPPRHGGARRRCRPRPAAGGQQLHRYRQRDRAGHLVGESIQHPSRRRLAGCLQYALHTSSAAAAFSPKQNPAQQASQHQTASRKQRVGAPCGHARTACC